MGIETEADGYKPDDVTTEEWHWIKAASTLSICLHADVNRGKEVMEGLRQWVHGPMGHERKVIELIDQNYEIMKNEYRILNGLAVMAYEVFKLAPSPAEFFERFDCEHFKHEN